MARQVQVATLAAARQKTQACARWLTERDRARDAFNFNLLCGNSLPRLRIEFAQTRHDLLRKERDVRDRIFMVQEAALAKHQQMAEAADAVAECFDLIVNVVRRAGKAGAALYQINCSIDAVVCSTGLP
jgi:hypothetical protein